MPPELVFGAGLDDLFIVRVASNVPGASIAGTLQYASAYLRPPLFVVMGHHGCGAVEAAIAAKFHGVCQPGRSRALLANILPALDDLDATLPVARLLQAAVESNVRRTMRLLLDSPEAKARSRDGRVRLVGAVYELETGLVRFLD